MRLLATLNDESLARTFEQYMLSLRIPCRAEASGLAWEIWIEREDDLPRAQAELAGFHANPDDPRFRGVRAGARAYQKEQDEQAERLERNYIDVRTSGTPRLRQHVIPVTITLIALSVLVAILTQLGNKPDPWAYALMVDDPSRQHIEEMLGRQMKEYVTERGTFRMLLAKDQLPFPMFDSIRRGQVWRLVTPMFLHFDIAHIAFNMWWLYALGSALERRCGSWFLLGLVLVSDLGSVLPQYFWNGPGFGGMSGVVYGLFGYVWYRGRTEAQFGIRMSAQNVGIMLAWLVICMTGAVGPVANAAHVGGLVVGMTCWAIPLGLRKVRRMRQ